MLPRPEQAALRQLLAELGDDLVQMDGLVSEIAVRTQSPPESWSPDQSAFVALHLHRWYTAAEAAFERIERTFVGDVPKGENWHQDLLRLMSLPSEGARAAMIRTEVAMALLPYLRFRHFLRHAYAVTLEPSKLQALAHPLPHVHARLRDDVSKVLADLRAALGLAGGTER